MNKKFNKVSKALAIGGVAVGLLGLGAVAYTLTNPKTVTVEKMIEVQVPVEVIKMEYIEVEKVIENNVTVEVPVFDVDEASKFCDRLLYDDVSECVEEVDAEDIALNKVLDFIDEEFDGEIADELEDKGIIKDEDRVELIRVYNDYEDIDVKRSDFDDNEYKFEIKLKIEDIRTDNKKYVFATLKVEDNTVELVKIVE